ncbi:MAG: methyltransferase domain-containing protein [Bdellovibrionales bacterium]|nr:methyltransferase domain-containing protein [Bdellovibrionales bacterium]
MPKTDTWNPQQYHAFQKERSAPFFDLLELIHRDDKRLKHAIDLGCGTGELTKILQVNLEIQEVIGIDTSAAMLEKCKEHEDTNLKFKLQSIEEALLQSPAESQDLVFSNASLQWCDDHESLFQQIFRALKKGGQVAIQIPANHDYPTHLIAKELAESPAYAKFFPRKARESSVLTPEKYAKLLFRLGFHEQHVHLQVYPHVLKSRDEVVEWVKGTMLTYYEKMIGSAQYPQFLKDFQTNLFLVLQDEKPFFYPFKRVHIWARK